MVGPGAFSLDARLFGEDTWSVMKADSFAKLVIMANRLRPARFGNTSSLLQEPVHSGVVP